MELSYPLRLFLTSTCWGWGPRPQLTAHRQAFSAARCQRARAGTSCPISSKGCRDYCSSGGCIQGEGRAQSRPQPGGAWATLECYQKGSLAGLCLSRLHPVLMAPRPGTSAQDQPSALTREKSEDSKLVTHSCGAWIALGDHVRSFGK